MKSILTACAVAAAMAAAPLAATAATVSQYNDLADGGTYDFAGNRYSFAAIFDALDAAGSFVFTFVNSKDEASLVTASVSTFLQAAPNSEGNVTAAWGNGGSYTLSLGERSGTGIISSLIAAGDSDTLTISYSTPAPVARNGRSRTTLSLGEFSPGDAPISSVPLPAGGAMLLGALGGLAALRRRKASA